MIPPWLRLTLVALALLLAAGASASAQPASTGHASTVRIVVTGAAGTTQALGQLVAELVADLPIALEWTVSASIDPRHVLRARPGDSKTAVRAWVDLSDPKRARIYVANEDSERFIVRFVPEPNGYDAVAREALGQILASSIAAFVAHEDAGISREDALREVAREVPPAPPESRPAPEPAPPKRVPPRGQLGVAYRSSVIGGGPVQHGAAIVTGVAFGRDTRFASRALVGYRAPARSDVDDIGVSLSGGELRLAAGVETDTSARLTLGALLGGGLDLVLVEPIGVTPSTQAHAASRDFEPMLIGLGTVEVHFGAGLSGWLGVGCDVDLAHPRYTVEDSGGTTPVWTPWVVRPTLILGVGTDFGGHERRSRQKD